MKRVSIVSIRRYRELNIKSIVIRIVRKLIHVASAKKRRKLLDEHFDNGLPASLRLGLEYLVSGKKDEIATLAATEAEARRAEIASGGLNKVPIWYSPKPGSAGSTVVENMRPVPGKVLEFTMQRIAVTGKNEKWGTVLHLLVRGFECERGVELGSCAGISALYLSSAPSLRELITVEGSIELAKIAKTSLKNRPQVTVVNSLFDEAIDNEIASAAGGFDFAFIDGHHEKVATIHYFNRLTPFLKEGALIVFDDVSWSYDMRDAWQELSERAEFAHTVDLGTIGVCVFGSNSNQPGGTPRKWDLRPVTGAYSIGEPHGWRK